MSSERFKFSLAASAEGSRARAGLLSTLHDEEIPTPIFMPVGTHASVRGQTNTALTDVGSRVLLANTYHLAIRPGIEVFRQIGGLHKFMGWSGSILTDSGGFQIFSLPQSRQLTEEGARFQNYLDGRPILLTPEHSIEIQKAIGSDIMMVLDQCVPSLSGRTETEAAMHLTHRWAKRSLAARGDSPQAMFAIVQGGIFPDLRRESARLLTELPFDGFAVGGLAVGEGKEIREATTEVATEGLPVDKPRYLMGVGTPLDILEAVHRGIDMFDCIYPTALAQSGVCFTSRGRIDLRRGVHQSADLPLDPECPCSTCRDYSRAYLHHLIKTKEVLRWSLIGAHNLTFYHRLMVDLRQAIVAGSFLARYHELRETLTQTDLENPIHSPKVRKRNHKPLTLGNYQLYVDEKGHAAIQHQTSGEVMHPKVDPICEARELYVDQAHIDARARDLSRPSLVVWDVGLGAATNSMALIERYETLAKDGTELRPLHVVSFENDLDSLRLALKHPDRFPHLRHPGPPALVSERVWQSKKAPIRWTLLEGDFLETADAAPRPEIIFYDPFSYKTDSDLWTPACFRKLYQWCSAGSTSLFTYSNSTAVRAGLLAAGFFVGKGRGTKIKTETTIAVTPHNRNEPGAALLGDEWLARWQRSDAKFPTSIHPDDHSRFEITIKSHPQFN
jgi:queuine tRNA-ribosyltransferase